MLLNLVFLTMSLFISSQWEVYFIFRSAHWKDNIQHILSSKCPCGGPTVTQKKFRTALCFGELCTFCLRKISRNNCSYHGLSSGILGQSFMKSKTK